MRNLVVLKDVFAIVERRVRELHISAPIKGRKARERTVQRFRDELKKPETNGTPLKLVRSMPRRLAAVIEAEGSPAKY